MAQVNRYLKDKDMDLIDHALGRPADPMAETYRNYFAIDTASDIARQFRESPNWREGQSMEDMAYFFVTLIGRSALRDHLKAIGDKHRYFTVTYAGEALSPVISTSHSKAKYAKWLVFSDLCDMPFGEFCRRATVRLA